jgi:hypothetical protein
MESTSATALVSLALKNGEPYSAAGVYTLADKADRKKLERNMFDKRRNALLLARWEHTPTSVLEALSCKPENAIVARLNRNPNTSAKTLSKFYEDRKDDNKSLRLLIAQHRHTSNRVLKKIAQFECDVASLLAVSKNTSVDREVLQILLRRFAVHPQLDLLQKNIAENLSTPAVLLEKLYQKGDEYVRAAVIGHANCSLSLLNKAINEKNILIQRVIAADRRLHEDVVMHLSVHDDGLVRCAVALNKSAPKHAIEQLAQDECKLVRRAVAARKDLTESSVMQLIEDDDSWVRQKLARNPTVSIKVLQRLAKDKQADVRRGVARNLTCPAELLKLLAGDKDYWVRSAVAYQPKTPKEVLEELVESAEVDILSGVANNANTPQRLLKKLASSNEPDIRRGVILNRGATRLTLLPLLEDAYYLHRMMLMINPVLKDEDKRHLCIDPDLQVRFTAFKYFANKFVKNSD